MAIITDVPTDRTIFPQQYVRVERVNTDKNQMFVDVGIYFNESVKDLPPHRIEHVQGEFDMYSSDNLWQQAYIYIKNRWPEYTDC